MLAVQAAVLEEVQSNGKALVKSYTHLVSLTSTSHNLLCIPPSLS
jgi:hypothetical protein